jgi:hypothetical protein
MHFARSRQIGMGDGDEAPGGRVAGIVARPWQHSRVAHTLPFVYASFLHRAQAADRS